MYGNISKLSSNPTRSKLLRPFALLSVLILNTTNNVNYQIAIYIEFPVVLTLI